MNLETLLSSLLILLDWNSVTIEGGGGMTAVNIEIQLPEVEVRQGETASIVIAMDWSGIQIWRWRAETTATGHYAVPVEIRCTVEGSVTLRDFLHLTVFPLSPS